MYAMLCGLFLGYSNVSWGGGQYFNGIVGVSLFAIPLLLSSDYNRAINGIVITVVDLAVGMAFPNPGWSWLTNTSMFVLYAGSFGGLALTFIAKKLPDRNKITGKWIATIAFAGLGVVAVLYGPFSHISARYLSVILPFARSIVPAVQTVAEERHHQGSDTLLLSGFDLLRYIWRLRLAKKKETLFCHSCNTRSFCSVCCVFFCKAPGLYVYRHSYSGWVWHCRALRQNVFIIPSKAEDSRHITSKRCQRLLCADDNDYDHHNQL